MNNEKIIAPKNEVLQVNQAVKRNLERFPEDFCFQLTEEEYNSLRSQIVTLKNYSKNKIGENDGRFKKRSTIYKRSRS